MPLAPLTSIGFKPKRTYSQQRSFLDGMNCSQVDEQLSDEEDNAAKRDSSADGRKNCKGSPLKRGNSELSVPPPMKRGASRIGSGNLRLSLGQANLEQGSNGGGDDNEHKAALKASHELRETGQSHRFKDEIEYILDGIRSKDKLKIRRTSCLELTRSMLKEDFVSQVRTYQYMPVIYATIQSDSDPIVFSCLVLMIGIALQDKQGRLHLAAICSIVKFLCRGLEMDMDPMAMIPSARHDITMYNDFKDLAKQSGVIEKGQKVLTKSIVLSAMTCIINECVAQQDAQILSIVDEDYDFLQAVVEILVGDLAWIKQPSSIPGVSLSDVLDTGRIESCLRILERLALVSSRPAALLSTNTRLFPLLVQLIALCRAHAFQYPQHTDSLNLMLHTLRLLINVTNGYEPCCERLAKSGSLQVLIQNFVQFYGHCRNYSPEGQNAEVPLPARDEQTRWTIAESRSDSGMSIHMQSQKSLKAAGGEQKNTYLESAAQEATASESSSVLPKIENDANGWYDILLLSIGLLVNMLESSPVRREQVTSASIGLDCKAMGDCFHKECLCEKSTAALERLVDIYNTEATISELTENQVLAAYLALLIGCIIVGNADSEARLCRTVTGHSLAPMLELLSEFAHFHEALQAEHLSGGSDQTILSQSSEQDLDELSSTDLSNNALGTSDISFRASKSGETQHSFLKIIDVLQEVEQRRVSFL